MTTAASVIDLTNLSSSPPVHLCSDDETPIVDRTTEQLENSGVDKGADVPLEDGDLPRAVKSTDAGPRKQRKRKKYQQDTVATKGDNVESGDKRRRREDEPDELSRGNSRSLPDRVARRRALRESPPEPLFFVDDQPADIRVPYFSNSLAGPSRTQQNGGLVLPPHVKVTDGSSETQEPPLLTLSDAEEDEEDFIDYLDVDGDRSVCISHRAPPTMYTNSENERSEFLAISMIPAKLIPRLDLPAETVVRKATTKPGTVLIK